MSRTRILLTASVLAALSIGACSSSGGHPADPAARHAATHSTTATGAAGPRTGGGSVGGAAWCAELARAGDSIVALGGSSTKSPGAFVAKAQKLADDAPSAIKPDVEALLAIDKKIVAGDKGAESQLADPAVLAHVRHFAAWLKANCKGVDIPVPDIPSATG